jgi:hypothetical protein
MYDLSISSTYMQVRQMHMNLVNSMHLQPAPKSYIPFLFIFLPLPSVHIFPYVTGGFIEGRIMRFCPPMYY